MPTKDAKKAKQPENKSSVAELFSRPIKQIEKEIKPDFVELPERAEKDLELEGDENLSAFQIKERNDRTAFVGNVDIDMKSPQLIKYFKNCGDVEKIWFRSIPVQNSKLSQKVSVILKKFNENAAGKNCYILFTNKEAIEKALDLNGSVIKTNHIRVDYAIKKDLDFTKTIFIGNLSFSANEEELRAFFKSCGGIENIRVIRDPSTHVGKGIAYITFRETEGFKNAMLKNEEKFKDRELRIKKAVPAKRLEKKKNKVNAVRRLKVEGKEVDDDDEKMDIIHAEDVHNALDNKELKEPDIDDVKYENNTKIAPRIIRKKIKKVHRKFAPHADNLKIALRETKKIKKKIDREVFDDVNEMQKRKEKRAKRYLLNKKKTRNENFQGKKKIKTHSSSK